MTSITVNGETQSLPESPSVTCLLEQLGLAEKRVAVELNGEIVPRGLHAETRLKDEDQVEIVQAIGGG